MFLATYSSFAKIALVATLTSVGSATPVTAAWATQLQDPDADSGPAARAKKLFDKAASEYDTSAYGKAVETFTAAYLESQDIEDDAFRIKVQSAIFYNLARAHIKAYGLDENVEHLNQAIELLNKSLSQTKEPKDQADARDTIAKAQAILDGLEPAEVEGEPATEETPPDEPAAAADPAASANVDAPTVNKPMRITGFALLGVGAVGVGLAAGGAAQSASAQKAYDAGPSASDRSSAESKGKTGNIMIISGASAAGLFLAAGVTLVILSKKKGKSNTSAGLMLDANTAGLSWGGRF